MVCREIVCVRATSRHRRRSRLPQEALSRWYEDGGTGPDDEPAIAGSPACRSAVPVPGEPELQALHVRVIALENLVIALLAETSEQGRKQIRAGASSLVPRPGLTRHPLTIRAAARRPT